MELCRFHIDFDDEFQNVPQYQVPSMIFTGHGLLRHTFISRGFPEEAAWRLRKMFIDYQLTYLILFRGRIAAVSISVKMRRLLYGFQHYAFRD